MLWVDRSAGLKVPAAPLSGKCAVAAGSPLTCTNTELSPLSFCGAAAMDPTSNRTLTSSFVAAVMGPLVCNALSAMAQLLVPSALRRAAPTAAPAGTTLLRRSGNNRSSNEQSSSSSKGSDDKPCAPRPIPIDLRPRPAPPASERETEQVLGIKKNLFGNAAPESELEPSAVPASHPEQLVHTKIQELLQPRSPFAAKVQVAIKDFGQRFGNDCPLPLFALALSDAAADLGVRVILRTVTETKQYWSGKHGRSFLMCMAPASMSSAGTSSAPAASSMSSCLIIDRGFRDAFTTPMMTPRYKQMCESLPEVFIGQPAQLTSLLHLACYEMDVMFRTLGRHVPPWRTFPAASARWLSSLCSDVIVPATGKRSNRDPAGTREVREFLATCERMQRAKAREPPAPEQRPARQCRVVTGFHVGQRDDGGADFDL